MSHGGRKGKHLLQDRCAVCLYSGRGARGQLSLTAKSQAVTLFQRERLNVHVTPEMLRALGEMSGSFRQNRFLK